MRTCNHHGQREGLCDARDKAAMLGRVASTVLVLLIGMAAYADSIQDAEIAEAENCRFTGLCTQGSGPGHAGSKVGYDPCYLAQNAMRPCTPQQRQPLTPSGVDHNIVGTWELSARNAWGTSRWLWQIRSDGSYDFHAEGPGAAPAHRGTFAASKGNYILSSTTMAWKDSGTYKLTAHDTLVAKGLLGTASWHRIQPTSVAASGNQPTNPSANIKR
jgi:hypothetical protein